jgi:hypothetical protein
MSQINAPHDQGVGQEWLSKVESVVIHHRKMKK